MDELFAVCEQDIQDIQKSVIESTAATAYNEVIFESAIEYMLEEETASAEKQGEPNEDPKGEFKNSNVKNALFKAFETLKRMAVNLLNKIKQAVNTFIAKANAGNIDKMIDKIYKDGGKDYVISITKDLKINGNASYRFGFGGVKENGKVEALRKPEEEIVKSIVADIKKESGSWDTAGIDDIKDFKALGSFVRDFVSKANDVKSEVKLTEYFGNGGFKAKVADVKAVYNDTVKTVNDFIKNMHAEIKKVSTQEDFDAARAAIKNGNKYLAFINSAYSGYLKWAAAYVKQGVKAAKTAKKSVNASYLEDFYGLSLL